MLHWLMKSEPTDISIGDLAQAPSQRMSWQGIRNYQARNFMRDRMQPGDRALFYHSSCAEPGIVGVVEIVTPSYPDPSQFDPSSRYFDARATPEQARWFSVDIALVRTCELLGLKALREVADLAGMRLLAKGNRLSIMPVEPDEWRVIGRLLK